MYSRWTKVVAVAGIVTSEAEPVPLVLGIKLTVKMDAVVCTIAWEKILLLAKIWGLDTPSKCYPVPILAFRYHQQNSLLFKVALPI